jgi:exodeoxyribonuclease V beta subunit
MHLLLEEYLGNHRELDVAVAEIKDGPLWETAVNQILDTAIPLEGFAQTTLRTVRGDCITEMQFHLPTKAFSREKLSSVLEAHPLISCQDACSEWAAGIADWGFHEFDGFLQGYIDLIFQHEGRWFVADYKSNQLASYSKEALEDAMLSKNYLLQARFYALALHRHLQAHLPDYDYDAHFGGIAYLFVRGFPEQGVWFERPPLESLESLGNLFPTLA